MMRFASIVLASALSCAASGTPTIGDWSNLVQSINDRCDALLYDTNSYPSYRLQIDVTRMSTQYIDDVVTVTQGTLVVVYTNWAQAELSTTTTNFVPVVILNETNAPSYMPAPAVRDVDAKIEAIVPSFVDVLAVSNAGGIEAWADVTPSTNWYWINGDHWVAYPQKATAFPALSLSNAWQRAGLPTMRYEVVYTNWPTTTVVTLGWQIGDLTTYSYTNRIATRTNEVISYLYDIVQSGTVFCAELGRAELAITNTLTIGTQTWYDVGFQWRNNGGIFVGLTNPVAVITQSLGGPYYSAPVSFVSPSRTTDVLTINADTNLDAFGTLHLIITNETGASAEAIVTPASPDALDNDFRSIPSGHINWTTRTNDTTSLPIGAAVHVVWSNAVRWIGHPYAGYPLSTNVIAQRRAVISQMQWTQLQNPLDVINGGSTPSWRSHLQLLTRQSASLNSGAFVSTNYTCAGSWLVAGGSLQYSNAANCGGCVAPSGNLWTNGPISHTNEIPQWSFSSEFLWVGEQQYHLCTVDRTINVFGTDPSTESGVYTTDSSDIYEHGISDYDSPDISWPSDFLLAVSNLPPLIPCTASYHARVFFGNGNADPVVMTGSVCYAVVSNFPAINVGWTNFVTCGDPAATNSAGAGATWNAFDVLPQPDWTLITYGPDQTKTAGATDLTFTPAFMPGSGTAAANALQAVGAVDVSISCDGTTTSHSETRWYIKDPWLGSTGTGYGTSYINTRSVLADVLLFRWTFTP